MPVLLASCLPAAAGAARPPAATFTGTVWLDADADGVRDRGEAPARGVLVALERRGRKGFTRVRTATTSATGRWTLRASTSGRYRVRVLLPSSATGFAPARKGRNRAVDSDVAGGGTSATRLVPPRGTARIDAGLLPRPAAATPTTGQVAAPPVPATPPPAPAPPPDFGDRVWIDTDSDGVQDPTEGGLPGAAVQLWDSALLAPLVTTFTDATGHWSIAAPQTNTSYRIRVVPPTPYTRFSPRQVGPDATADSDVFPTGPLSAFTDVVSAAPGSPPSTSLDTGVRPPFPVNVGNLVWRDDDANGRQDAGEPGLAAVPVQLFDAAGLTLLQSTTTNGSGIYNLVAPGPGTYRIHATLPAGASGFTTPLSNIATISTDSDIRTTGSFAGFSDVITLNDNLISITTYDVGIAFP